MAAAARLGSYVSRFWSQVMETNLTGQAAMVAYNLLLSIFPLAALALFIAGQVLNSPTLEQSVVRDLKDVFPGATTHTLTSLLDQIRNSSAKTGILAMVASVWFGSSFWSALDTAFCRIYGTRCRTWREQKRFALGMLLVVLLFLAASVVVPATQSILSAGAKKLPFGLSDVKGLVYYGTLGLSLLVLFATQCLIYWRVPLAPVSWRSIWPGALGATFAIAVVDFGFPLYLANISTIARFGTTLIFIVIVLVWFYAIAAILLGGAIVNALRLQRA